MFKTTEITISSLIGPPFLYIRYFSSYIIVFVTVTPRLFLCHKYVYMQDIEKTISEKSQSKFFYNNSLHAIEKLKRLVNVN